MSHLRIRYVPPRRLSRSHRIGAGFGIAMSLVGVLGLVLGWGSSTSTKVVDETPQSFVSAFSRAERVGDSAFLLSRLDAAVLARYGAGQCNQAVARLADPSTQLRLVSVSGPASYAYASDGKSVNVPNTYTMHVTGTRASQSVTTDVHGSLVGHRFRIFLDCGTPLAGAS